MERGFMIPIHDYSRTGVFFIFLGGGGNSFTFLEWLNISGIQAVGYLDVQFSSCKVTQHREQRWGMLGSPMFNIS